MASQAWRVPQQAVQHLRGGQTGPAGLRAPQLRDQVPAAPLDALRGPQDALDGVPRGFAYPPSFAQRVTLGEVCVSAAPLA